jgi:hypothetical protein
LNKPYFYSLGSSSPIAAVISRRRKEKEKNGEIATPGRKKLKEKEHTFWHLSSGCGYSRLSHLPKTRVMRKRKKIGTSS